MDSAKEGGLLLGEVNCIVSLSALPFFPADLILHFYGVIETFPRRDIGSGDATERDLKCERDA